MKRVKEGEYGQCIFYTYENGTLKSFEVILRGREKCRGQTKQSTLCAYLEMSQ
jgi:hypothetical protein